MYIISKHIGENGAYPPIQTWDDVTPPENCLEFPDRFIPSFYPPNKQLAGFVDITVEDGAVTACTWNEEAYQAYMASLPEPAPEPDPIDTEPVTWAALDAAYQEGVSTAYDQ